MPLFEPVVLAPVKYSVRHIGPRAAVWPNSPASQYSVLTRADMVARPLPMAASPESPDFVQGAWTARLGDAGEGTLTFPNVLASDGGLWRSRFDSTNHLQWLEIYANEDLEQVVVFDQVGPITPQQVQVHGFDGFWLTKKAYERDWICTQSPRDVIMRGCSLWVPVIVDEFPASETLSTNWTTTINTGTSGGQAQIRPGGGLRLSMNAGGAGSPDGVNVTSNLATLPGATGVWQAFCNIPTETLQYGSVTTARVRLMVTESTGDQYAVTVAYTTTGVSGTMVGSAQGISAPFTNNIINSSIRAAHRYNLMLESDGMFVYAFVNGTVIACVRRGSSTTTSLQAQISLLQTQLGAALDAVIGTIMVRAQAPWLRSSSDPGEYVLPGDQTTYPWGGLQARYFNDLDLVNDADVLMKLWSPTRSAAYGAPNPAEYALQQDSNGAATPPVSGAGPIAAQGNPASGASAASRNWSAVWFGSIYLKMSAGDYQFQIQFPGSSAQLACRIWVGRTNMTDRVFSQGMASWVTGPATFQFTVSQASLTGQLSYGQGSLARDGWYPIVVWYAVGSAAGAVAPTLQFFNVPTAYTDPGGTAIASGAQSVTVPKTSCSPLGCIDQRYQGVSHFDMIQQAAQGYGYQIAVEPAQLESGSFPGVLAPRIREGHDSDVILMPDDTSSKDAEGVLNPQNIQDVTDFASSIIGNGAGTQSGNAGQVQSMTFDPATMNAALFDAQMWQDFSDAAFPALLDGLLNAQLSLVLQPWQLLSADPYGRPRLAFTWPLPGSVQAMRWRPGDGLQIRASVINLWDQIPRQILVLQRSFVPEGIIGTTATFVNRPKTRAHELKQEIYRARRWQRNYQKRHRTLSSNPVINTTIVGGANDSSSAEIALNPSERLVGLTLVVTDNSGNATWGILINGIDVSIGSGLFGDWQHVPAAVDLMPAWGSAVGSNSRIRVKITNTGVATSNFDYQVFADVIR